MSRLEAAARVLTVQVGDDPWTFGSPDKDPYLKDASEILEAADAYDAAHNVHRVVLSDATVERAIAEISHHVTPVIGWMVLAASQGRDPDKYHDDLTKRIELAARAVLAAAVKEER